ncbi:hypothetical protein [Streptomyces sp. NPDC003635]
MSAAAAGRVGRYYTAARRHPWVLGKVADWRIPLGPYTPAQIALATVGGFLLIKSVSWWSWMGPVPVAAWLLAIWAVRRPKIRGRAPLQAALGWIWLGRQPRGGRIGGRAARDRGPQALVGGFTVEAAPGTGVRAPSPSHRRQREGRRPRATAAAGQGSSSAPHQQAAASSVPTRPRSGVQQLLEQTGPRSVR